MKKVLIASLIAFTSIAQSKEINLVCQESELNWKVSFNTQTSKGVLNVTNTLKNSTHNTPVDMRSTDSEYILFNSKKENSMDIEFRVNRETLVTTIIRTFTGTLSSLTPSTKSIPCSIAPAKTNLI